MCVIVRRAIEAVMEHSAILAVDAAINVVLGGLLIAFPRPVVDALGVPAGQSAFYSSILGGVLVGIGIALFIQVARRRPDGLGLSGTVAINLCGGIVLVGWLVWGDLDIPVRGRVFLWCLVAVLVGVSIVELRLRIAECDGG
jgi:hypothetical protein